LQIDLKNGGKGLRLEHEKQTRPSMERRLAAILAADIVGYSRLMEVDETATFHDVKSWRAHILEPLLAEHHGRVVKLMGDGVLAEFASAINAVQCAIALQHRMTEANADAPADRQMLLRVGINLGDVVVEDDDIFGDGVNIAARLEGLAEPGAVYVSAKIYDEVRRKLDVTFDDLGAQAVKNIAEPVHVYRVAQHAAAGGEARAGALPLPDKPSLAVLPFTNMSGDADQEYFADGIVEDVITALSRVRWFFVIARNTSFTYKGRTVDVKQVGRELGVRYVLEGSVRRAGNRVRITGQLVEAESGTHIWADRFDGEMADVFELQDRVTASVVAAIEPRLRQAEIDRARRKPTARLDAYDWYLRALPHFYAMTREGNEETLRLLDRAIAIDPHFALAKALAVRCYAWRSPQGWAAAPEEEKAVADRLCREALLDTPDDPTVLWMVGFAMWQLLGEPERALDLYDRSLALNPNGAQALALRGWAMATAGRPDEAIPPLLQALRLSPLDTEAFFTMSAMGCAYLMAGRFDEAIVWTGRALRERPTFGAALRFHAICLAELGRLDEARDIVAQMLRLEPGLTIPLLSRRVPIYDARLKATFLAGLRKAGLPG
jgi:adenylate cyclase